MQFTMDMSQIFLMVITALIGLVWNNLKSELSRLDVDNRHRVDRMEAEARERTTKNEIKIEQIERDQTNVVRAVGDLKAFIENKLGQFKLELARDHVTKDDLREAITASSVRLETLERDIRELVAHPREPSQNRQQPAQRRGG